MTVAELVENLKKYPQSMEVLDGFHRPIEIMDIHTFNYYLGIRTDKLVIKSK